MTDLAVQPFTKAEAEQATEQFIASGVRMRHMLLDLHERKAHTALGFGDDFEQYVSERLGVSWKADYLRLLRLWARVERDTVSMDDPRNALTQAVAVELNRLPSAERAEAYQESLILQGAGKNPLRDIKHIVNRRLGVTDKYKGNKRVDDAPAAISEAPVDTSDVPVGALVDVHTGRPVVDEPKIVYEREEAGNIVASIPEVPGAFSQGATEEEARENVIDAAQELAGARRDLAEAATAPEREEESVVFDDEPTQEDFDPRVSVEAQHKIHAFRAYYAASGRDLTLWQTVEEIVNQLYTIKKDRLAKYE